MSADAQPTGAEAAAAAATPPAAAAGATARWVTAEDLSWPPPNPFQMQNSELQRLKDAELKAAAADARAPKQAPAPASVDAALAQADVAAVDPVWNVWRRLEKGFRMAAAAHTPPASGTDKGGSSPQSEKDAAVRDLAALVSALSALISTVASAPGPVKRCSAVCARFKHALSHLESQMLQREPGADHAALAVEKLGALGEAEGAQVEGRPSARA